MIDDERALLERIEAALAAIRADPRRMRGAAAALRAAVEELLRIETRRAALH